MGQFTIDPNYIKESLLDSLKHHAMYRTPGMESHGFAAGGGTLAAPSIDSKNPTISERDKSFPIFNTPPTILFCDESLAPGESKTYTYQIPLPTNLPSSHRGKVCRITYKLLIGVQRDALQSRTKVISIPFRLFNRTDGIIYISVADGTRAIYEVLQPAVSTRDEAVTSLVSENTPDASSPLFGISHTYLSTAINAGWQFNITCYQTPNIHIPHNY